MKRLFHIFYAIVFCFFLSCSMTTEKQPKINGVSFVASNEPISELMVQPLLDLHANYAALMPFGFLPSLEHPEITYNTKRQWFGERKLGIRQYAEVLKKNNIKIMLKPQIWVMGGEFTGFIKMSDEKDWELLENSYSNFILDYAHLAQKLEVSLFCIGTELASFISERPLFWSRLIKDIRAIYKGPLTYAANWNEFTQTPFWDDLDYIGIDAYFPITDQQIPSLKASSDGWQTHKTNMRTSARIYDKAILFTEFGYRSMDYAGRAPWTIERGDHQVNLKAQQVLTKTLFQEFWHEDWFAGGFVWKWFHKHQTAGGGKDNRFTPQNKPAEEVIRTFYKNHSI